MNYKIGGSLLFDRAELAELFELFFTDSLEYVPNKGISDGSRSGTHTGCTVTLVAQALTDNI